MNKRRNHILLLLAFGVSFFSVLFIFVVGLYATTAVEDHFTIDEALTFAIYLLASLVFFVYYILIILKRIRPIRNIYVSYSMNDSEIAYRIQTTLKKYLQKTLKSTFAFFSVESISFGSNMLETMKRNISQADIIIVLASDSYIGSEWCQTEFNSISFDKQKVIPIVIDSFDILQKLPNDLRDIKSLILRKEDSESEFEQKIAKLAYELIRDRLD